MTNNSFINILIAEDNDVSRELMASILKTQGYNIYGATDGGTAIEALRDRDIDLALVDINMAPSGGFDFVKHLVVKGIKIPVVIITGDSSSDILMQASSLGVNRVLQKPVNPERLLQTVQRILRQQGLNPDPLAVTAHETRFTPGELMQKAVDLAARNVRSGKGGPFGAVITDGEGRILGEGTNGITSRADPTAHAEVLAIRQAAEKLRKTDLSGCILYCSGEPTMMGKALIISVGIKQVYFGLSHEEIRQIRERENAVRSAFSGGTDVVYTQIGHDSAADIFHEWEKTRSSPAD